MILDNFIYKMYQKLVSGRNPIHHNERNKKNLLRLEDKQNVYSGCQYCCAEAKKDLRLSACVEKNSLYVEFEQ